MASFDFTQLSSSNQLDGRFANPSINDAGTVTYEGFQGVCTSIGGDCLQTGTNTPPNAIYTSTDGSSNRIVDRSSYDGFSGFNSGVFFSASTNNAGTTVSAASGFNSGQLAAAGPSAVLSITGGSISNVAYSSTPFGITLVNPAGPFDTSNLAATGQFDSAPGINNQGTIAYIAGNSDGTTDLYTKSSNGSVTTIANTGSNSNLKDFYLGGVNVSRGQGPFASYTLPSINASGTVAFNADLKGGGRGLFTSSGGAITPVVDTSSGLFTKFSVATLNDSGTLAFDAGLANGGSAIYTSSGGKLTTIADTSGLFQDLTLSDVAINQKGQVAFLGQLKDGTVGIFDGSNPVTDKVIAVGDKLGNYTVQNLFVSHEGLNNSGQLAFDATLGDGNGNTTEQIFLADPTNPTAVPAPNSVPLLGISILVMIAYRWRRGKQSVKQARH